MIERLNLRSPIFERTAREGHVGVVGLPWEEAHRAQGGAHE
jgi:S-adenosylmethionine synthetase